jgi:hypothetical protein
MDKIFGKITEETLRILKEKGTIEIKNFVYKTPKLVDSIYGHNCIYPAKSCPYHPNPINLKLIKPE